MKHMSGVYSRPLYRLALLAALALFLAPFAYAHLELERTAPEANARVEESPAEIRLWFSERPLMFGTTIHLEDSARKLVPATDAQADRDPRSLSGIGSLEARINNLRASPVCKLLILGCRLLIPDRLLGKSLSVPECHSARDATRSNGARSLKTATTSTVSSTSTCSDSIRSD